MLGTRHENAGICKCGKKLKACRKYCSRTCYWKNKIGTKHNWGYKIGDSLRGKPKSKEHREKVAAILRSMTPKQRNLPTGEKNKLWKGDKARCGTIHDWVYRYRGSPKKCEDCGTTKKKWYHWANISGEYKRDLKDWKRLCVPCHNKFDKGRNSLKKRFPTETFTRKNL